MTCTRCQSSHAHTARVPAPPDHRSARGYRQADSRSRYRPPSSTRPASWSTKRPCSPGWTAVIQRDGSKKWPRLRQVTGSRSTTCQCGSITLRLPDLDCIGGEVEGQLCAARGFSSIGPYRREALRRLEVDRHVLRAIRGVGDEQQSPYLPYLLDDIHAGASQ